MFLQVTKPNLWLRAGNTSSTVCPPARLSPPLPERHLRRPIGFGYVVLDRRSGLYFQHSLRRAGCCGPLRDLPASFVFLAAFCRLAAIVSTILFTFFFVIHLRSLLRSYHNMPSAVVVVLRALQLKFSEPSSFSIFRYILRPKVPKFYNSFEDICWAIMLASQSTLFPDLHNGAISRNCVSGTHHRQ